MKTLFRVMLFTIGALLVTSGCHTTIKDTYYYKQVDSNPVLDRRVSVVDTYNQFYDKSLNSDGMVYGVKIVLNDGSTMLPVVYFGFGSYAIHTYVMKEGSVGLVNYKVRSLFSDDALSDIQIYVGPYDKDVILTLLKLDKTVVSTQDGITVVKDDTGTFKVNVEEIAKVVKNVLQAKEQLSSLVTTPNPTVTSPATPAVPAAAVTTPSATK